MSNGSLKEIESKVYGRMSNRKQTWFICTCFTCSALYGLGACSEREMWRTRGAVTVIARRKRICEIKHRYIAFLSSATSPSVLLNQFALCKKLLR